MSSTLKRLELINSILDRGVVVKMLPSREAVVARLLDERPANIYIGADPTGPELHLSHAKNYMLLEEFRQLGHRAIVLFGDFTARIGDPTNRTSTRARLDAEQVRKNVEAWVAQIRPVIDFESDANPAEIIYNSEWLSKLTLAEVIELASNTTVQRMLERDMFERRMQAGEPIHLHEFLYPLLQGYDSVAMNIDIELCGTDQEFNALMGRSLCARIRNQEKLVIMVNLMENPLTGELMSKTSGRGVFLSASPADFYGQVMALPDEMTRVCFVNNTRLPISEIDSILQGHPRMAKARLAHTLVSIFHGEAAADLAEKDFQDRFVERVRPESVRTYRVANPTMSALDIAALGAGAAYSSRSALRRVIEQGGLHLGQTRVTKAEQIVTVPADGVDVRVGKKAWFVVQHSPE